MNKIRPEPHLNKVEETGAYQIHPRCAHYYEKKSCLNCDNCVYASGMVCNFAVIKFHCLGGVCPCYADEASAIAAIKKLRKYIKEKGDEYK